ncbi:MAG: nitrogen regulation protein NR(I) [Xanthomonadales bacterium]|nr:nitrogen regulation protein NR(I) [Xanthomonadales bacterium]
MTESVIWIVDDDASIRFVLERALAAPDRRIASFANVGEARSGTGDPPDLVLTDLRMPGDDGLTWLDSLSQSRPDLPVIVMTAYSDLDTSVQAYARGAFDYLPKPFDVDDVVKAVDRALETRSNGRSPASNGEATMLGESPAVQQLFRVIGRLSRSRFNVLITGETGTGKELVARALHHHSPLRDGPFVALNTAAIPSELLESELFGHEKGAFTGAQGRHVGRFEQADKGTLFLDEIGDMPARLQTRLLRVLAEGEFYRVGGRELRQVDVRIIAATHQDLRERVNTGAFREDLFHRLNVVHIHVPPLRERGGDILLLARHFLGRAARESGLDPKSLSADAEQTLLEHPWRGNVRELENLCRRLTVLSPGSTVRAEDITEELGEDRETRQSSWADTAAAQADGWMRAEQSGVLNQATDMLHAALFRAALARTKGRRAAAAELLGIGRNTLTRRIKALRKAGLKL